MTNTNIAWIVRLIANQCPLKKQKKLLNKYTLKKNTNSFSQKYNFYSLMHTILSPIIPKCVESK